MSSAADARSRHRRRGAPAITAKLLSRVDGSGNNRKQDVKRGAAFSSGRDPNRALKVLDDSQHNRQAEARSLPCRLGGKEWIEDPLGELARNARARVGDDDLRDLDRIVTREPPLCARRGGMLDDAFGAVRRTTRRRLTKRESRGALQPNDDPAAAAHRVDRIDEKIDEELLEVVALAGDEQWLPSQLERDVDGGEQALRSQERDRRPNDLVDVDRRRRQRPGARSVQEPAHASLAP